MCIRDRFSVEADESKGYHIKEVKADGNVLTETDGVYTLSNIEAVSYTHLDVYKRQSVNSAPVWFI